jgi:hypothetical protein
VESVRLYQGIALAMPSRAYFLSAPLGAAAFGQIMIREMQIFQLVIVRQLSALSTQENPTLDSYGVLC